LHADERGQSDFIDAEKRRIYDRTALQETASRHRDNVLARKIDNFERDATKDQLMNYRRLCRADSQATAPETGIRSLYSAVDTAQALILGQKKMILRDVAKKQEHAIGWLSCLGDNALAAVVCEAAMKDLTLGLQKEKERALTSLHAAIEAYTEQHNAILDAIVAFSGKVHQHAADFTKREQLVSSAFKSYLVGIVENKILPGTDEQKKKRLAWEGKLVIDRYFSFDAKNTR
jgi:hypothetical protein